MGRAAPFSIQGPGDQTFEFYQRYDHTRPASDRLELGRNVDLAKSEGQFYYAAIHARIKRTNLPPPHAQLEDADVFALLKLVFREKLLTPGFLHENWSGVFGTEGVPLSGRRPMGRPAVEWNMEEKKWRYVCVGGAYTLCGGGHLRQLLDNDAIHTTESMGTQRVFPWQRPRTRSFKSFKQNVKVAKQHVLQYDEDIEVDWDLIDWPQFLDKDRMSETFVEFVKAKGTMDYIQQLGGGKMRQQPVEPLVEMDFDDGESNYDVEETRCPLESYATPTITQTTNLKALPTPEKPRTINTQTRAVFDVQKPQQRGPEDFPPFVEVTQGEPARISTALTASNPPERYHQGEPITTTIESPLRVRSSLAANTATSYLGFDDELEFAQPANVHQELTYAAQALANHAWLNNRAILSTACDLMAQAENLEREMQEQLQKVSAVASGMRTRAVKLMNVARASIALSVEGLEGISAASNEPLPYKLDKSLPRSFGIPEASASSPLFDRRNLQSEEQIWEALSEVIPDTKHSVGPASAQIRDLTSDIRSAIVERPNAAMKRTSQPPHALTHPEKRQRTEAGAQPPMVSIETVTQTQEEDDIFA